MAAVVASLFITSPSAVAHSTITSTSPTYKTTLKQLPTEVSITFSETPLTIEGQEINSIKVFDPAGRMISAKTFVNNQTLSASFLENKELIGTYIVRYRIASADGHVVNGNYEFYLGQPGTITLADAAELEEHADHSTVEHFLLIHTDHILYVIGVLIVALVWIYRKNARRN